MILNTINNVLLTEEVKCLRGMVTYELCFEPLLK